MENTYTYVSIGRSTKYKYNEKLYITRKTFDDGTNEEYTYDPRGNRTSITDAINNTTTFTYDAEDNLTAIKTGTAGRVKITASGVSLTGSTTLAGLTFTEATGKTAAIKIPDMNNDGKVGLDDFTSVALLKGIDINNPQYNEKNDVNANGIINTPDLDYMKDYLSKKRSQKSYQENL